MLGKLLPHFCRPLQHGVNLCGLFPQADIQMSKKGRGKPGETLEKAAELLMGCFRVCAADKYVLTWDSDWVDSGNVCLVSNRLLYLESPSHLQMQLSDTPFSDGCVLRIVGSSDVEQITSLMVQFIVRTFQHLSHTEQSG